MAIACHQAVAPYDRAWLSGEGQPCSGYALVWDSMIRILGVVFRTQYSTPSDAGSTDRLRAGLCIVVRSARMPCWTG